MSSAPGELAQLLEVALGRLRRARAKLMDLISLGRAVAAQSPSDKPSNCWAVGTNRMFDLVTETWNPITGCNHECVYCWARRLATTRLKRLERYRQGFVPRLNASELGRKFKPGTLVFAVDMGDIFSSGVEDEWVLRVLKRMAEFPETTFLLLTKNPAKYFDFLDKMPGNAVLGATIETDDDDLYRRARISKAPPPSERLKAMKELPWDRKFISVEPILSFTPRFADEIAEARPLLVYVGYDNYGHELPEPTLDEVLSLIRGLRSRGIEVRVKTLRPAWHEDTRILQYSAYSAEQISRLRFCVPTENPIIT